MTGSTSLRRWLTLAVGVGAIVLGATITLKPYDSLDTLVGIVGVALTLAGAGDLLRRDPRTRFAALEGMVQLAAGVAVLLLPDVTVRLVAVVVGLGLVASGALRLVEGLRRQATERFVPLVGGAAALVAGVVALSLRDVTVLVVGLLVGPVLVVIGVGQVIAALSGHRRLALTWFGRGARRGPRWLQMAGAVLGLAVALLLAGVSAFIHRGAPEIDAFYDTPAELPATAGELLRSGPFDRALPDGAEAVRILYTTTRHDGAISTASGLVVWHEDRPAEPAPVLAWAHGTTGVARRCAPTLLPDPFAAGAMPALAEVLRRDWVLVATDYIGLGTAGTHPYLVGPPAAHSVLDAVRAARQLDEVAVGDTTVVWGHSQGGGAALWTGVEAAGYAPDVPLAGVAALAPASDLPALAGSLLDNPGGALMSTFLLRGYSAVYDDVRAADYFRASALPVVEQVANRCLAEPAVLLSIGQILIDTPFLDRPLEEGALMSRLAENVPAAVTGVPTLVAQGLADTLVLPDAQAAFVARLCEAGQVVDYRGYPDRDHLSLVADDSPLIADLLAWTEARMAGEPPPEACETG